MSAVPITPRETLHRQKEQILAMYEAGRITSTDYEQSVATCEMNCERAEFEALSAEECDECYIP